MISGIDIWQESDSPPVFRFQTDDENVHWRLSKTKGFKLVGWGENLNLWIYIAEFSTIQDAKDALIAACR